MKTYFFSKRRIVAQMVALQFVASSPYIHAATSASKQIDAMDRVELSLSVDASPSSSRVQVEEETLAPLPIIEKTMRLTLDDCIRLALARNQQIIASGYGVQAAEDQFKETRASFWPIIDYKYRAAPVPQDASDALRSFFEGQWAFFNSVHVGMGIPVTGFGRLREAQRLAAGGIEAARARQQKQRLSTTLLVKQLYYGVQFAQETIELLDMAIEKISDKLREQEAKEIPDESPLYLLKVKVFRAELEKRRGEAKNNKQMALAALRVQTGLPDETDIQLASERLTPDFRDFSEITRYAEAALSASPDAKLANTGLETRERQYRMEKLKLAPKMGLGAFFDLGATGSYIRGVTATDSFNDPFNYKRAGIGLQIEGNLDFHGAWARIRQAKAEYLKAAFEREIAQRGISLEVRKKYEAAQLAMENLKRARTVQSMTRRMVYLSKVNVDTGVGEKSDYYDALQQQLLSRANYFKAVFDYNLSLADLEYSVGPERYAGLTPKIDVPEHQFFSASSPDSDSANVNIMDE